MRFRASIVVSRGPASDKTPLGRIFAILSPSIKISCSSTRSRTGSTSFPPWIKIATFQAPQGFCAHPVSPRRHGGHSEKFVFVERYRQTEMFAPETYLNAVMKCKEAIFAYRYLPIGEKPPRWPLCLRGEQKNLLVEDPPRRFFNGLNFSTHHALMPFPFPHSPVSPLLSFPPAGFFLFASRLSFSLRQPCLLIQRRFFPFSCLSSSPLP